MLLGRGFYISILDGMSKKYNVILIGIDALRADHLGCYGYPRPTSPNIDALANKGLRFENCFSQAPNTAPSFMSIMTSRYPSYHGVIDNIHPEGGTSRMYVLDEEIPTIAQIVKRNGYSTAAFTDGANVWDEMGFGRGFDYYSMNWEFRRLIRPAGGSILTGEILYWLKEHSRDNFFLFFHTYAVHTPWFAPQNFRGLYGEGVDTIMVPPPPITIYSKPKWAEPYLHFLHQVQDAKTLECYVNSYDGALRYVDDFIGKLVEFLDETKLLERTIIIFTSDHGEEFSEHGGLGHHQFYSELLHVPLIIKSPHFQEAQSVPHLVRSIDIFPTILELLGIKIGFPVHGVSLVPSLKKDADLVAAAEAEFLGWAVQAKDAKYICHQQKGSSRELYDLNTDPKETKNIADANPGKAAAMSEMRERELGRPALSLPKTRMLHFPS